MENERREDSYDTLIQSIVRYVYEHDVVDANAIAGAKLSFLDALGCAAETAIYAEKTMSVILGPLVPGNSMVRGFRLPGTALQLDPVQGALDLSTLIRFLDHNDGYASQEWGHPSDNIGGILAVLDWLARNPEQAGLTAPPQTLATAIQAVIKAYEVQGCLQLANPFNSVGLDHVILVKVASTAVAGWLLGLPRERACAAVSHAWVDGHALRTYRQGSNTGPRKGWAAADAASRAVWLVLRARAGEPGVPQAISALRWGFEDATFRGRKIALVRPFSEIVIQKVFYKIAAAEAHSIAAMEAILKLRKTLDARRVLLEDIKKIAVRTTHGACLIISKTGKLNNAADRDHCMQYILAVALLKGDVLEYADYTDGSPWASDPRVDEVRAKMELVEDAGFTADYLDETKKSIASGIRVSMGSGWEPEEVVVEYPLGHPSHPNTKGAVRTKWMTQLSALHGSLVASHVEQLVELQPQTPVDHFLDLLWKGDARPSL